MFRWSVILLAALMSIPALWSAFVSGSMPVTEALIRFLIAIGVSSVMVMFLRSVTESYQRGSKKRQLAAIRAAQAEHQARTADRRQG